jgi:hypothetical protein
MISEHAAEAEEPGRLPGQPEHGQGVEAVHLVAALVLKPSRANPLADRGCGSTETRGE